MRKRTLVALGSVFVVSAVFATFGVRALARRNYYYTPPVPKGMVLGVKSFEALGGRTSFLSQPVVMPRIVSTTATATANSGAGGAAGSTIVIRGVSDSPALDSTDAVNTYKIGSGIFVSAANGRTLQVTAFAPWHDRSNTAYSYGGDQFFIDVFPDVMFVNAAFTAFLVPDPTTGIVTIPAADDHCTVYVPYALHAALAESLPSGLYHTMVQIEQNP